MDTLFAGWWVAAVIVLIWVWQSVNVIKQWERGVILRLGRMLPEAKGLLLSGDGCESGGVPGRQLYVCHVAEGADHLAQRLRPI